MSYQHVKLCLSWVACRSVFDMEVQCDATLYGAAGQRIIDSMRLFNNKIYRKWSLALRLFDVRDLSVSVASFLLADYHSAWSNRLLVSLSWEVPCTRKMTDERFDMFTRLLLENALSFDAVDTCDRYSWLLLRLAEVTYTDQNTRVLYRVSRDVVSQSSLLHSTILTTLSDKPCWGVNHIWISHLLLDACFDLGSDEFARALYDQLLQRQLFFTIPMSTSFAVKIGDAANRWNLD